jgi:hypothetical protein
MGGWNEQIDPGQSIPTVACSFGLTTVGVVVFVIVGCGVCLSRKKAKIGKQTNANKLETKHASSSLTNRATFALHDGGGMTSLATR